MKNTSKAWLVFGLVLILLGILLSVGVLATHQWDFRALGAGKLETGSVVISEPFRNLRVEADTEELRFLPSEDGGCRIDYALSANRKLAASVTNRTLSVEVTDPGSWRDRISFSFGPIEKTSVTVYLPRQDYAALSIQADMGDLLLPGDFSFESISARTDTGDVDCRASSSGPIRIETDTGDLSLEGISAEALALSSDTGRITLRSVSCAGELSVTVNTGKATLSDVSCGSFASKGDTGDLTLERVLVSGLLSVERDTGDVRLEGCDAAELLITTDTGDVSGTLLTEKVFVVRSSSGKIRVPETVSGGKCKITTSTGDIRIQVD